MKQAIVVIAFLGMVMLAGCSLSISGSSSTPVPVPSGAKLLLYGPNPQPAAMQMAGTYYVYDEYHDSVVYAEYVKDGSGLKGFSPLGHLYRVYFVADEPSTQCTMQQ